jgi:hypothetical protein
MTNSHTSEREQALRWLIANRRPGVSVDQAIRVMSHALPRDIQTSMLLQRIAQEEEAKETAASKPNWRTPPGLPRCG